MHEKQQQKTQLKETCSICGKPVAQKASSDVTRYLSFESRCTCINADSEHRPGQKIVVSPDSDASGSDTPPSISQSDVEANLGDNYEVLELLGQGGMGVVYKVRDRKLGRTFAIKVLNPSLVEDSQSVKRFQQEASAAKSLTHVNLAAVYDFGVGTKGAPYIVMDYLDGQSLGDIVRKEGFVDAPRALDLFIQMAEAVANAHSKGVIHRDIKPNNIIVCPKDGVEIVKLVDFGIAKVLPSETRSTQMTQTGEILGSPLYMSPEQCLGNRIDQRADIYALGCVMYEILTGIAPFDAENPIKVILKHINDEAKPFAELKHEYKVPLDLERIIFNCLEKEPISRYQTAEALLRDLTAVRDGKKISIVAKPKKKAADLEKGIKRRNLAVFGAISAAVLLMVAAWAIGGMFAKPAVVPLAHSLTDPRAEADEYDRRAAVFFAQGEYEKAIDLLMFNLHTYKENGQLRDEQYLADCTQHVGKCYLKMNQNEKAKPFYRDALKIYNKWGNRPGTLMPEAVTDYATVLRNLGEDDQADKMLQAWLTDKNSKGYSYVKNIP